nr:hypothetical protein [Nocardioides jishulii]
MATVVAVVAGGAEDPAGAPRDGLPVDLHAHRPARRGRVEVGGTDVVAEADVRREVVLLDHVVEVVEDPGTVSDHVVVGPRLERVAEGVQVGVGADAGIAEEVPRPTDPIACLQDGEGGPRPVDEEVAGSTDPGESRPDHQHVDLAVSGGQGCGR